MTDLNANIAKQTEMLANTALTLVLGLQRKQPSFLTNNNDLIPTKDDTYNIGNNDNAWKSITADGITILGNNGDVKLQSNVSGGGTINLSTGGGVSDLIEILNTGGNSTNAIDIETTAEGGSILITANKGLVNINTNPTSGKSDTHIADGNNSGDVYVGGLRTSNVYIGYSNDNVTSNVHITATNKINIGSDESPDININGDIKFLGTVDFTDVDITGLSGDGFNGKYKASDIELNALGTYTTTIGNDELGGNVNIASATIINLQAGNDTPSAGSINIKTSGNSNDIIQIINEKGNDIGVINVETIASGGGITLTSSGGGTIITDNNNGHISLKNIGLIKLDGSTGDVTLETDSGSVNIDSANEITLSSLSLKSDYEASAINLIASDGGISLSSGNILSINSLEVQISGLIIGTNSVSINTVAGEISIFTPEEQSGNENDNINITNSVGNSPAINLITSNIYSPGESAININALSGGVQITSNTGGIALWENSTGGIVLAEGGGGIYIAESGGGIEIVDSNTGHISIDSSSGTIGIGNADHNDSYYDGFIETTTIYIGNSSGEIASVTNFFGTVDFTDATVTGLSGGSSFSGDFIGDVTLNTTGSGKTTIGNSDDNGGNVDIKSKNDINISGNDGLKMSSDGPINLISTSGNIRLDTISNTDGIINIGDINIPTINIGNTDSTTTFNGTVDLSSATANSLIIPPKSSIIAPVTDPDNISSFFFNLDETYSGQTFFINCANVTPNNIIFVEIPPIPGFKCTIIYGGNNGSSSGTSIRIVGLGWPNIGIFYGVITKNINNITQIYNIDPGVTYSIDFFGNSNVGDYVNIDVLDNTHIFARGFSTADNALNCVSIN